MENLGPEPESPSRRGRIRRSAWTPLVVVIAILALVQGFAVKAYQIPSGSMEPTLEVGDRILVNRLPGSAAAIEPGDIAVFAEPEAWGHRPERSVLRRVVGWIGDVLGFGPSNTIAIVKRVVAQPEQEIECCDSAGAVIVDGVSQPGPPAEYDFPFVPGVLDCMTTPQSRRCFESFVVPPGEYVVLGDNRAWSADSLQRCRSDATVHTGACILTVPQEDLIGPLLIRIWPLTGFGAPSGLEAVGEPPAEG